jgi:hypothetical protein
MATFTGSSKLMINGTLANDADIGTVQHNVSYTNTNTWSNGTGANQANMIWTDTRTINASSSEDLDLAGGLTNGFGNTVTFTKIKGIMIKAASGNTNNVLVGGDATSTFLTWVSAEADQIIVRPGGIFYLEAPDSTAYAVTATTGDLLHIENSSSGTSVSYDIILIGTV